MPPRSKQPSSAGEPDPERAAFTKQIVKVLKQLDAGRSGPTPNDESRSRQCYEKLQFDFPIVDAEELVALAQDCRESLHLKSGWFPYKLNETFINNIVHGAKHSPPKPAESPPEEEVGVSTDELSSQAPVCMQAAYQQLCAAVLIQFVNAALSKTEDEAWLMLQHLADDDGCHLAGAVQGVGPSEDKGATGTQGLSPLEVQLSQAAQADNGEAASFDLETVEATSLDDDDFLFEDMEGSNCIPVGPTGQPPRPQDTTTTSSSGADKFHSFSSDFEGGRDLQAGPAAAETTAHSRAAIVPRLISLSSHASIEVLGMDEIWKEPGGILPSLLQLIRTVGIHQSSTELQSLLCTYMGLISDRMVAKPSEISALEGVWEALGVSSLSSMPPLTLSAIHKQAKTAEASGASTMPRYLPAEAEVAFSLVATLAPKVTAVSARGVLWQQVHRNLVKVGARCLEDLCKVLSAGRSRTEVIPAANLTCQVLFFYIDQRPGNVNVGLELTRMGVTRSLSMLHPQCCSAPEADPIRGLTLAAAAQCSDTYTWLMAVPKFQQHGEVCGFDSVPEGFSVRAHEAVWKLLAICNGRADAGHATAAAAAVDMLESGKSSDQVPKVLVLLSLMQLVRHAAGKKPAWGSQVESALTDLLPVLRGHSSATAAGLSKDSEAGPDTQGLPVVEGGESVNQTSPERFENGGTPTDDLEGASGSNVAAEGGEDLDCGPCPLRVDEGGPEPIFHGLADPGMLQARHARQLAPTCIRLVKELLTSDRGKTD